MKLIEQIFGVQVTIDRQGLSQCGPTAHGLPTIRLVYQGSMIFCCVPFDKLPGRNYTEKRTLLNQTSGQHLKALVDQNPDTSAIFVCKAGSVFYMPAGTFVLSLALEETRTATWALGGDENQLRKALLIIADLVSTYPSMQDTNYAPFQALLMKFLGSPA